MNRSEIKQGETNETKQRKRAKPRKVEIKLTK